MRLPICFVGCGRYARVVLDDIRDMTGDFELFFASRDRAKAREYCKDYGGSGYFGSYEDAVSDARVRAVYFTTPHDVHLENTLLAARHSKHILMEKPLARTLDESNKMIAASSEAGVKLMVAENYRFLTAVEKCKEVVAEGAVGDLRLIQIQSHGPGSPSGWRTSAERTGGGMFIDGGIHFVDILLNIGGFPERVYAARSPKVLHEVEGENGMVLTAHMPGEAIGVINISRGTAVSGGTQGVNVTGSRGQVNFVPQSNELTVETPEGRQLVSSGEAGRGVRPMMREFHASIRDDRPPVMSGEEGLKDLAVVLAAYRSVEQRREVSPTLP